MCTSAYQALLEEHRKDMSSLEAQIKDAGKQLKATERAISIRNKKVAAVNKKVAQKAKVLSEWQAKIDAKQEQVAKSAATQKLVDTEVLRLQEEIDKETQRLERTQQMRAAQEMEAEQLKSSCLSLEADTQEASKTVTAMKASIAAAQTAVKNRTDEIRDKFLSAFVVDDAEILIELLNKEVSRSGVRDGASVANIFT
jgi:chromosome segregation ATPase